MKYTIKHLRAEFGTDSKCLQFIFDNRYGDYECPQCKAKGKFYQLITTTLANYLLLII